MPSTFEDQKFFSWLSSSLLGPLSSQIHSSSSKEIESEDCFNCIQNSEIIPIQISIQKFNSFLNFLYNLFRLEICVYKFLARSVGHLCLSSLSQTFKLCFPRRALWHLRTLFPNLQGKSLDPHLKDQSLLALHLAELLQGVCKRLLP